MDEEIMKELLPDSTASFAVEGRSDFYTNDQGEIFMISKVNGIGNYTRINLITHQIEDINLMDIELHPDNFQTITEEEALKAVRAARQISDSAKDRVQQTLES